jgi:hypothetical protein
VGRHKKHPRIPEGFPDSEVAKIQEVLDSHGAESNEDDLEQIPPKRKKKNLKLLCRRLD